MESVVEQNSLSSFHGMISSFHGMIPSYHGMIRSLPAVFGLRQRGATAKVIDYKGKVIRAAGGITTCVHGHCRFAWRNDNHYLGMISANGISPKYP